MADVKTQSRTRRNSDDAKWAAVAKRDAAFDGAFYYSVKTTGVYCRPSCASRLAKRENVRFHKTSAEAEAAGFRACKRCMPNQPSSEMRRAVKIAEACRLIEATDGNLRLSQLAHAAGLSPYHFHRIFKSLAGVTPKAYAIAHRHKRVRAYLAASATVTNAIYDAGFNSNGRFYAASNQVLGMSPSAFRNGGKDTALQFAVGDCSLGAILVAASTKGVAAIFLGDDPEVLLCDLQDHFPQAQLTGSDKQFETLVAHVIGCVEQPDKRWDLPLDIRGTAFQHQVWQALRDIPLGQTASYADIAKKIGRPAAVRAVASACGGNAHAVAIPCHRVVRSDGALSGYRWGIERKRALLQKERKLRAP